MTIEQLRKRRADVLRVVARHGGRPEVLVFGSTARGEAGAGSDLDLIVELQAGRSLMDRVRMGLELEEMLGLPVETVSPAALHPLLRASVLAEAQRL
ncbi:MAG: nucleotidyltransferase family protein [Bryobacteraceae bacterium]|nr:nucleotidyltransferase family protein [Bryobacteraceae bacterium]